jgi:tetratricopeptide (TPR) repeat protein
MRKIVTCLLVCTFVLAAGIVWAETAEQWYDMGSSYHDWGNCEKAIECYTKSIAIDPNYALSYESRGNCYNLTGKYTEALSDLNKALEIGMDSSWNAHAYDDRAWANGELGNLDQALKDANTSIALNPEASSPYGTRAWIFGELKMYEAALDDFNKSLSLNPSESVQKYLFFDRGEIYQKMGKIDNALSDYNKACDLGNTDACTKYQELQK